MEKGTLRSILKEKGYHRISLKRTITNHFEVKAKINRIEGNFILDTGASSSCIDFDSVNHFNLSVEESEILAAGAGAANMITQIARQNSIEIKGWEKKKINLVLFDLSHVNEALVNHNAEKVHGIIGADVLKAGKAIIDCENKALYLKNKTKVKS
jgi:predicted aspartyl protease